MTVIYFHVCMSPIPVQNNPWYPKNRKRKKRKEGREEGKTLSSALLENVTQNWDYKLNSSELALFNTGLSDFTAQKKTFWVNQPPLCLCICCSLSPEQFSNLQPYLNSSPPSRLNWYPASLTLPQNESLGFSVQSFAGWASFVSLMWWILRQRCCWIHLWIASPKQVWTHYSAPFMSMQMNRMTVTALRGMESHSW